MLVRIPAEALKQCKVPGQHELLMNICRHNMFFFVGCQICKETAHGWSVSITPCDCYMRVLEGTILDVQD